MLKHRIEQDGGDLSITVEEVEGQKDRLLEAFQECREGRCSCPTDEYRKLETLEMTSEENSIYLQVTAQAGQSFRREEIEKCLQYTEGRVATASTRKREGGAF